MIKGRYAEEAVLTGLSVMRLLNPAGVDKAFVIMENRLWESGSTGGEIYRCLVGLLKSALGINAGAFGNEIVVIVGKYGTARAEIYQSTLAAYFVGNGLYTPNKFRSPMQ